MQDNFFILRNIFLKIWIIQQKMIKNICQRRISENLLQLTIIIDKFTNLLLRLLNYSERCFVD